MLHAPKFWYQNRDGLLSHMLYPASQLWRYLAHYHEKRVKPVRLTIPVVAIGSPMIGGSGKTPITIALAKLLQDKAIRVDILSRGYGANLHHPVKVNPSIHSAREVGDEPLMMARHGLNIWVGRNRAISGTMAEKDGADLLLMDDGMQHKSLHKSMHIMVLDGGIGLGNGRILPAGPLRESMAEALQKADLSLVMMRKNKALHPSLKDLKPAIHVPVYSQNASMIKQPLFAFCGLAHPEKFFHDLHMAGHHIAGTHAFPDHYFYKESDIESLITQAKKLNVHLITTEKDAVRLDKNVFEQANIPLHIQRLSLDEGSLHGVVARIMKLFNSLQ